jgi:hypothetical protein
MSRPPARFPMGAMGESMDLSAEDIIRGGSLPTASVQVCMHADLTAQHEELERELHAALNLPRDSLAAGSNANQISEQIRALEEQMRGHTVTFTFRALPRRMWKLLIAKHPPRKTEDGSLHERDGAGVNADTFYEAMIRACATGPDLPDEVWDLLFAEKLTDRQFDQLANAAWRLNRHEVDVPFSPAASRIRNSEPE